MKRRQAFVLVLLVLVGALVTPPACAQDGVDYLSFGVGGYNFDKIDGKRRSVDYRIEYEWGLSLLPLISESFRSLDPYFRLHPNVGFEGNTRGAVFGNAGLNLEIPFIQNGFVTLGEAAGVFGRGGDSRGMGSAFQFRSQLELGWQFDNHVRVSGFISHISSAGLFHDNPGAEIVGVYIRLPFSWSACL